MPRKKKTTQKKEPTGPQEYMGHKVGDYVYCHREPDDKLSFGKITNIHLKDKSGIPCFTFICENEGKYRLGIFDKLIKEPTAKMKASTARKLKAKNKK